LNPQGDGNVIRVPIPALTGERRQELVKVVHRLQEEARVKVRGVRREYNDLFRDLEADRDITQDDLDRALKKVQDLTDEYVRKVDTMASQKEKEVLDV